MGDHHEGPFTVNEIDLQVRQGIVTPQHFVWMQGMTDWKMMNQVPDFTSLIQAKQASTAPPPLEATKEPQVATQDALGHMQTEAQGQSGSQPVNQKQDPVDQLIKESSSNEPESAQQAAPTSASTEAQPEGPQLEETQIEPSLVMEAPQAEKEFERLESAPVELDPEHLASSTAKHSGKHFNSHSSLTKPSLIKKVGSMVIGLLTSIPFLFLVFLGVLTWAFGTRQFEKVEPLQPAQKTFDEFSKATIQELSHFIPGVGELFYSIPLVNEITDEDFSRLDQAASSSIQEKGAQVELAIEKQAPRAPRLFVATNLPEGTALGIYIKGVSGTLLNHFGFTRQLQVQVENSLAVTAPIRFEDGKPIPQGQYFVYIYDLPNQSDTVLKTLTGLEPPQEQVPGTIVGGSYIVRSETVFLGGEKDKTYLSRLRLFHKKIKNKALNELSQLKQFIITIQSQFQSSSFQFNKLSKLRSDKDKIQRWNKFSQKWLGFYEHMNVNFKDWTEEKLTNEFFYSDLHRQLKQLSSDLGVLQRKYSEWVIETNPQERIQKMKSIDEIENQFRSAQERLIRKISVSKTNLKAGTLNLKGNES